MTKALVAGFVLFTSAVAFASINDEFESLKNSGASFTVFGSVCEEVMKSQIAKDFPQPQYRIDGGISYSDNDGTLGELDVVVFEDKSNTVVQITEMKCWNDLRAALAKARDQRSRFLKNKARPELVFKSTHTNQQYSASSFSGVTVFETASEIGGKAIGFDREIPYTIQEMKDLRSKLIACQSSGECKAP